MRFSTLADWLGWLEQSHPTEIELGLTRIRAVAERLELLKPSATVITVAGTNGKGSCVTACAKLLRAAGHSVGVYTSPHLLHYAERIQIDGKPVSDADICLAFEKIAAAADTISLTYFEYGTLAALEIFQRYSVDYLVLEVGLGGRLDAVNIIDADIAIITSIALDHQDWLGETRELIGYEKAGILRSRQIFICADSAPPQTVIEQAARLHSQAYYIGREFNYSQQQLRWQWWGASAQGETIQWPAMVAPQLPLPSMAAAVQALQLLNIPLSLAAIEQTLAELRLAGRFQHITYAGREWILDVAHNPAATEYLARRLEQESCAGKTYALVAMMADKDCAASLANLVSAVAGWYLVDLTHIHRAAPPQVLAKHLAALQVSVEGQGDMAALIATVLAHSNPADRIVIFGSFYTVAAALHQLAGDALHAQTIG